MPNYKIEYSAREPVYGELEFVPANNEIDAGLAADDEIAVTYPEYTDFEVTKITEIKS